MASENENEKRETLSVDELADKVLEIAAIIHTDEFHEESHDLERLAAEIKAAWKRERDEIEAQALSIGGIVEASRHKPGNAAAMREALEMARDALKSAEKYVYGDPPDGGAIGWDDVWPSEWHNALEAVERALSAPARNCECLELPTDSNGITVHISDRVHMLNSDSRGDHEWDDEVVALEYVGGHRGDDWLVHGCDGAAWACECTVLAPAAERKGECDGR